MSDEPTGASITPDKDQDITVAYMLGRDSLRDELDAARAECERLRAIVDKLLIYGRSKVPMFYATECMGCGTCHGCMYHEAAEAAKAARP